MDHKQKSNPIMYLFERAVFGTRWALIPMYAGLAVCILVYSYKFIEATIHLVSTVNSSTEEEIMLNVLNLVDISMIANLILMILIGGYSIFIRTINFSEQKDRPHWLNNINSGTLKVKMGMSLIGVTAIHLLKDFVNAEHQSWEILGKRMAIHSLFILSGIILALIDKLLHPHPPGEKHES